MRRYAFLLIVLPSLILGDDNEPICVGGNEVKSHTSGMDDLKFWDVSLCRYSTELQKYVAEFKALRVMEKSDRGRADIRVTVSLKNGKTVQFECSQDGNTNEYYANGFGKYEPLEVISFKIDAIRESWLEEAEFARQDAERQSKQAALDRELKRMEREEQRSRCRFRFSWALG